MLFNTITINCKSGTNEEAAMLNELPGSLFLRDKNSLSEQLLAAASNKQIHLVVPEERINSAVMATKKKRGPKPKQKVFEKEPTNDSQAELLKTEQSEQEVLLTKDGRKDKRTFINCDLRYFNFDFLVEQLGSFDGKAHLFCIY